MPAFESEIEEALEEGVEMLFLTSPKGVEEHGAGLSIQCIKNRLGDPDKSGRRTPLPLEGSEFHLEADTIITAIGEVADLSLLPKQIEVSSYLTIAVDELGSTSKAGVFACGDVIDQPRSIAHAIGSGKKVAIAIDCYLKGRPTDGLRDALRVGEKGALSFRRYLGGMAHEESQEIVHSEPQEFHIIPGYNGGQIPPAVPQSDCCCNSR